MRARDTFVRCSPPRHRRWLAPAPAWPARSRRQPRPTARSNEHDNAHRLLQSIRGPSTLGERSLPGAAPLFTARRCTLRCPGDAKPHRPFRSEVSSAHGAEAGSGPELDIQSPPPVSAHWSVTRRSENGLGPPRERRANGRTLGKEPGCLSPCEIRPFLFEPDWPAQRAHARLARASSHPRNGRRIV
jgi:hypothetical protein